MAFDYHPDPNEDSWRAAEAILALLRGADERSLVFFLLSGGGSALAELPIVPGMRLDDLQGCGGDGLVPGGKVLAEPEVGIEKMSARAQYPRCFGYRLRRYRRRSGLGFFGCAKYKGNYFIPQR